MYVTIPIGPMDRAPRTAVALFAYGGVHPQTHLCLTRDVVRASATSAAGAVLAVLDERGVHVERSATAPKPWHMEIVPTHQDAMIDRARAFAAKHFLANSSCEVLVMIDHDIEWMGADDATGYEGDLLHIARLAYETQSVVGAAVSKRVAGQGFASILKEDRLRRGSTEITIGRPGLVEAWYVGAALTAYPRNVIEAVTKTVEDIPPGYPPIFEPCCVPHYSDSTKRLALSEDWALCHRAAQLGHRTYLATKPMTVHWGDHGYTVVGDAVPKSQLLWTAPASCSGGPAYSAHSKISVLHATRGRPEMAAAAYRDWMGKAGQPGRIEWIFSTDEDDPSGLPHELVEHAAGDLIVLRGKNRGCVDAYNAAAYASSGDILVQAHDDVSPPQNWDVALDDRMNPSRPQVLHVSDGLPHEVNNNAGLLTVLIGTRRWFRSLGWFWCPRYVSIGCDDDMQRTAEKFDVVVEATDLVFQHAWGGPDRDETQRRSYHPENWAVASGALDSRTTEGFAAHPEMWRDERPAA